MRRSLARVRRCIAVNKCISHWMFSGKSTQCVINPALGQERRATQARRPAARPQRVLVIGAGPSGCEAAILAADHGNEVELIERTARIGGQPHAWAAASPFRTEVLNMVAFYETELERAGATVRFGMDAGSVDLDSWDTVLRATGTEPQDSADDAVDVLASGRLPDESEVTVFGETGIAMFAALWLAENGKQVHLVSPADEVGNDINDMECGHLAGLLDEQG